MTKQPTIRIAIVASMDSLRADVRSANNYKMSVVIPSDAATPRDANVTTAKELSTHPERKEACVAIIRSFAGVSGIQWLLRPASSLASSERKAPRPDITC